VVTTNS